MNGFYLAKKNLKYSGYLDLIFIVSGSLLFFAISIHKLFADTTSDFKDYSTFFGAVLKHSTFFRITVGHFLMSIFLITLISFAGKVILGSISIFGFFKSRSLMLLCAAILVIFLPLIGGIVAINTYHATTSPLAPRYLSSYSLMRRRIRSLIGSWAGNADSQ